jgi:hypothetical protein
MVRAARDYRRETNKTGKGGKARKRSQTWRASASSIRRCEKAAGTAESTAAGSPNGLDHTSYSPAACPNPDG